MGDSGSLFLGYACGILAVASIREGISPVAVILALTPFLFDAAYTLCRRLLRGVQVWRPHRFHLYQRVLIAGKSHRAVAHWYYGWAVFSGVLALLYSRSGWQGRMITLTAAGLGAMLNVAAVAYLERRPTQKLL